MALKLEPAEIPDDYWREPSERAYVSPVQCTCGRFARFIRYQQNTMPHGEAVTTVQCSRCGEVYIR